MICLLNLDSVLVSGSTTNKVIIHSDPIEIMKMDHSGIQAIVNFKNDRLILDIGMDIFNMVIYQLIKVYQN